MLPWAGTRFEVGLSALLGLAIGSNPFQLRPVHLGGGVLLYQVCPVPFPPVSLLPLLFHAILSLAQTVFSA